MNPPAARPARGLPAHRLFWLGLGVLFACHLGYGLQRLGLGIDFTDEGGYVAWPLRTLFGERLFAGELITLMRPLTAGLSFLYRLDPGVTLYDLRLAGWAVHLLAFGLLAYFLFRLTRAPLLSPLVASVPLYVCHIYGLAPPSYNSFSSDLLLLALTLRSLAEHADTRHPVPLHLASGLALFLATLMHAGLGLVGAAFVLYEIFARGLVQNLLRRRLARSNLGVLAFLGAWLAFAVYLVASGAAAAWLHRVALFNAFNTPSIKASPLQFYLGLIAYPFTVSRVAQLLTGVAVVLAGGLLISRRPPHAARAAITTAGLALAIIASFILVFSDDALRLPYCLAQAALILLVVHAGGLTRAALPPPAPPIRCLLAVSVFAALVYATVSFYFSIPRSWMSGILGLPFAFAVGLGLLLTADPGRHRALFRLLAGTLLAMAVACVAREHYRFIYRDAPVDDLQAEFQTPKLRHIRSTPERVAAVDALCAYLRPRLVRGEPLVAYDNCPMLYFILDAKPAYNLAFAMRYTQSPGALVQLNRELVAAGLPRYAIRNLVDITQPVWRTARRLSYADYPLNETVMAHYELERTFFPFEVWRLKTSPAP